MQCVVPKCADDLRRSVVEFDGLDVALGQRRNLFIRDAARAMCQMSMQSPPLSCPAWRMIASDTLRSRMLVKGSTSIAMVEPTFSASSQRLAKAWA